MKITVVRDTEDFNRESALRIADVIREKPDAKIGLSTGRTTRGIHAALVQLQRETGFDCGKLRIFGIDEISNMERSCPASCYYILQHEVAEPLGILPEHFYLPDPMASLPYEECRRFESYVDAEGGPDFIFLGLGENGHLGFNQPGTPFGQGAWHSYMDASLEERIRRENQIPDNVRMGGMTLGIRNLMQCRRLVLAANGENKAEAVERMVTGPVTEQVPASVLRLHPDCEVILDPAAARRII